MTSLHSVNVPLRRFRGMAGYNQVNCRDPWLLRNAFRPSMAATLGNYSIRIDAFEYFTDTRRILLGSLEFFGMQRLLCDNQCLVQLGVLH